MLSSFCSAGVRLSLVDASAVLVISTTAVVADGFCTCMKVIMHIYAVIEHWYWSRWYYRAGLLSVGTPLFQQNTAV